MQRAMYAILSSDPVASAVYPPPPNLPRQRAQSPVCTQQMRSHLLTLSCLLGSSGVCAAAPASLIADLPDVGDEGEDEDFLPIGDGLGGGGGGGAYVYEGEMMEYGMWDDGMDDGYYDEPEDVDELLRHLFSRFDANRDEHLDVTELRAALQAQAQEYQEVAKENAFAESEQILQQADEDGDGKLDEAEFGRMETVALTLI